MLLIIFLINDNFLINDKFFNNMIFYVNFFDIILYLLVYLRQRTLNGTY